MAATDPNSNKIRSGSPVNTAKVPAKISPAALMTGPDCCIP